MGTTIFYRDMIKEMDAAGHKVGDKTFSMTYLNCSITHKTGGDWITVENVQKCGLPYSCQDNEMRGYKDSTGKVTAFYLHLVFEFNKMTVTP
jgi:hypothetical protein